MKRHENGNIAFEGSFDANGKHEGLWKAYYENGKPKSTFTYKNGLLQGPASIYYPESGKISAKVNYINDKKEGEEIWYNEDGTIDYIQHFKNDILEGDYKSYFSNGEVNVEGQYLNGKKTGKWISYSKKENRDGDIFKIENFLAGEKHGVQKTYLPAKEKEGNYLWHVSTYENGKEIGESTFYHENGQIHEIIFYKNYEKDHFQSFNKEGKIIEEGKYLNDMKTGIWKNYVYPENGNKYIGRSRLYKNDVFVIDSIFYENGQLQQLMLNDGNGNLQSKEYYQSGSLLREGEYKNFKKEGIWKEYFDNSTQLKISIPYSNNMLNGIYISYHLNGKVFYKIEFEQNKMMEILLLLDKEGKPLDKGTLVNGNGTYNDYNYQGELINTFTIENGTMKKK
ncbi:hypothetical protein K6119_11100 [Paracrocinitomix mangrovi]|uniref:toxin-antitoxin system YwqK family antitoxin n=1 Tax=Paracrocinitomix mangrovi TaxID=2862509 RepID=UPI001C8EFC12|nr:hypothetical protein [Paracrocinitomix mangrovi]UKN00281.1 hypothetical protein K6119_11100 [Paracrocinitomix mangrovi]